MPSNVKWTRKMVSGNNHGITTQSEVNKLIHNPDPGIEWLVEITPIEFPDNSEIVIVTAVTDLMAARRAFETRNIPDSWIVTHVERGDYP